MLVFYTEKIVSAGHRENRGKTVNEKADGVPHFLAACCVVMLLTAVQKLPASQSAVVDYTYLLDYKMSRRTCGIPSGGIEIPGTLTLPAGKRVHRVPPAVFEHDLFGDRSTHGVFEGHRPGWQKRASPVFRSIFPAAATAEDFSDNCPFFIGTGCGIAARV